MFKLYERVEALLEHGWSRGNVSELLGDGRYRVYIKHLRKEVLLNFSALRPPTERPGEPVESSKADTPMEGAKESRAQPDQPATAAPTYGLNDVAVGEQPEVGDEAADTSASPERKLENSQDTIKPPAKKETSYRRKGKLQKKARIVFKEPAASPEAQGEDGTSIDAANDPNPEGDCSKGSGIKPKRKRGRSVGSLSGLVIGEANEVQASTGATRPNSRRHKRAKFYSAIRALKAKERKPATGTSSSTRGTQAKKRRAKANDPPRYGAGESSVPASRENFSPVSDDEMTLTAWIPEADRRNNANNGETPAPFTKTSPIWGAVDSLEIFRKMPQCPHFRPLSSRNEVTREGLAIAAMVNFSAVVEKISKFNFDEPASLLEDCLESLSELETHGFVVEPIRKRVDSLLSIKTRYDEAQALTIELIEEKVAMSELDQQIEGIEEQIQRLEDERSAAETKRAGKDDHIRALQVQFNEVKEFVDSARGEFERVANVPW